MGTVVTACKRAGHRTHGCSSIITGVDLTCLQPRSGSRTIRGKDWTLPREVRPVSESLTGAEMDRLDTDCDTARLIAEIDRLRVENLTLTRERNEARAEAAYWANR